MINKQTGEISLGDFIPIGPSLTREQFLSSSITKDSKIFVENEPYCSYVFYIELPEVDNKVSSKKWSVVLYFYKSILEKVNLTIIDEKDGNSWADWSEEKEMERKKFHDKCLEVCLGKGKGYSYDWGKVASEYDPRSGSSSIFISYNVNYEIIKKNKLCKKSKINKIKAKNLNKKGSKLPL